MTKNKNKIILKKQVRPRNTYCDTPCCQIFFYDKQLGRCFQHLGDNLVPNASLYIVKTLDRQTN